ncbi:MAG: VaFE repeat-containing surface-anchored protein [Lachnospiraceae bacterium]|nr:VaFE repeat-containing surface-anchored protein [Lachnospiraceae bacterium]
MNNNRTRRILSLLLSILMVLSAFAPLTVYAAEEEEAVTESEEMAEEPTIERAVPHPSFTPLCYYDYSQFPVVMHLNAGTPGRSLLKARSLDGKTGTLSLSGYYEYFGGTDTYGDPMALGAIFLISVDGVTYEGVCGQSYMPTPPSGEYTVVEVSGYTADEIKLALMAGIGDLSWYGSDVYGDLLNESSVGWTHGLVSYLNTGSMASYPYNEVVYDNWEIEALDQAVANIDWLLDNDSYVQDVINRTHLYQTVGGANQDIMFVVTDDHIPSTDIDVNKVNPNADPLSGAVFTIYSDAGYTNEIGSMTSDEDGYAAAHFDEDYDVLYVIETEFPTGYSSEDGVHPEFVVEIADGWGHVNGGDPVVNTPNTKIRIHKINTENDGLPGAVFEIYDEECGTLLGSMTTDDNGNADSEEFDRYYATVYVVETSFPSGYTSGDGEQPAWTVDVDPVTGEGYLEAVNYQETDIDVLKTDPSGRGLPGAEFEVYDEKDGTLLGTMITGIGGNASLHIDQYLTSVFIRETKFPEGMTSEDGNQPEWTIPVVNGVGSLEAVNYPEGVIVTVLKLNENEEGLPGAEFEVYDEKGGTLLGTMVTDEDGNASMELDDNYASVYVIETVFPDNYTSREGDETEWVVSILQGVGSITVYNYHETDIDVYKTDPSGRGLPGAEFEVYDKKDGTLLGTMTTGNGGSASLHIDQYLTSVYIVETVCPPGMTTEDGEDSWTIPVVNGVGGLEVVNYPETDIDVFKTDPSGNGLPGAEFTVYDYKGGSVLGTMVTDENGEASMHIDAYYTSVYIVETEFPDGYGAYDPDEEAPSWTLEIPADTGKATLYVTNYQTSVDVIKENPAGDRLAGALFGIYTSDAYTKESRIGEMITDENGTASFTTAGHYSELYVKEEEPAAGCELPEVNTWTVEITDGVGHVNYGNPVINTPTSLLYARKVSSNPVLTEGNRSYDFSGIQFKVYTDKECTKEALDTNGDVILLESNSAGSTGGVSVSPGIYYVREVEKSLTGKGWEYNPNPVMIEVPEDGTDEALVAEISNEPLNDPMGIQITKITSDPDYADADLSGAQYTIRFYEGQYTEANLPGSANATWVVETKKHGKNYRAALNDEHVIMGDPVYGKDKAGNYKLPLGTIMIEETKAPEGFTLIGSTIRLAGGDGSDEEDGKALYNFVDDQGVCSVVGGNQVYSAENGVDYESSEKNARGDLSFTKKLLKADTATEVPMAGIPFMITSKTTGETHYVVTDANGFFSTAAVQHTTNTNENDEILSTAAGNDGVIPASVIAGLSSAGVWFGADQADDTKGALPLGKYDVTELKTEANKDLDMVTMTIEVKEENSVTDGGTILNEEVPSSTLSAKKVSGNPEMTDGNSSYDYSGIEFKVYTDEACTTEATDKAGESILLTTDAQGETPSVFMEMGVYYVREVEESLAGKGWVYNPNPVKVTVPERGQAEALVAEITNTPMFTAQIDITKVDESGAVSAGSDLSGAEYTVRYYAGQYTEDTLPASSDAEWVIKTIKDGSSFIASLDGEHLVSGEAVYGETEDGDIVIPLGTITIEETKAPAGFVLEGSTIHLEGGDGSDESEGAVLYNFVDNEGSCAVSCGNQMLSAEGGTGFISTEMFARGELTFTKKILGTERPMAGIPFKVKNVKTGETHYVVTGEDGVFSSTAVAHSENTNGNDEVLAQYAEDAVIPASVIEGLVPAGLWFGSANVDDSLGSMPVGSYEVTELKTESNQHMVMVTKTFTVKEGPDVTDGDVIYNVDVKIHTTALDADSMTHYALAEEQNVIIDTVYYENAVVGETYVLTATAMVTENGEVLEGFEGTETFTTEAGNGSVEVRIVFDASDLAGKTITIYEEMTTVDGSFVADHAELLNKEQMIHYPAIGTNAKDADTNVGLSNADAVITITDTVSYTNLNTDKRYTLSGMLVDKATGYPVLDDSGNPVTASKEFRPASADGEVELTFTFKGVSLAGTTAVVFEELKNAGKTFAVHADIEDEAQTVYIPDIHTTAVNKNTGIKLNEFGETVLIDTVAYTNLLPGKTYTLKAKLYDKTTGELTSFTGETTFTPAESSGTVDVEISLDTEGYEGHTFVAYETAFYGEVQIADHSEPDDEDQTTFVAKLGTVAKDAQTEMQLAAFGETTFIDTVSYENLIAGEEYTMKASLYDKTAGSLTTYTGETTFTAAEGGSGTVDVEIGLDTTGLANHDLVCYEDGYYKEVLVATHKDKDDEGQTIHVAEIGTVAVNKETNIKTNALGETIIKDTVEYKNLIPGKEYTLKAQIYDQTSGALTEFKAEKTFTPEEADGSVEVEIPVNTKGLEGHDLVAYETAYYGEIVVADHQIPDSPEQTTEVPKIGTVAKDSQTEIQLAALGETTFIDTVSYENLVEGKTYVMKASLFDKTKSELTSYTGEQEFVAAEGGKGTVDVEIKLDATGLAGHDLVCYENAYYKEVLVESHENPDDEGQTIHVAEIATKAVNKETNIKTNALGKTVILDTVEYKNLIPGKEYTLKAQIYDQTSGALTKFEAEKTFTPEEANGSVDVEIPVNTEGLEGHDLVAFETAYYGEIVVADHQIPDSPEQTTEVLKIGTTAKDKQTSNKQTAKGKTVIVDTVKYTGLEIGQTYRLEAVIYDKDTKEETEFKTSYEFTPETKDGEVDVEIEVDTTGLDGHTLVVFEKAYYGETLIADHAKPDDEEQTVYVPAIFTSAYVSTVDGEKGAYESSSFTIVDRVFYENLVVGETYTVSGILMDQTTGTVIMADGAPVTASTSFTAENTEGSADVVFTFNATGMGTIAGREIVVFEDLILNGVSVNSHDDFYDKDQTITIFVDEVDTSDPGKVRTFLTFFLGALAISVLLFMKRKSFLVEET